MNAGFRMMDGYRRFARSHAVIFICVNLILLILWMNLIMCFSGENAEISGGRSARILVGIVNIFDPSANVTLENYDTIEALDNCEKVIRKLAHMFEYAVLAMLAWSVLFGFRHLPRRFAYIIPVVLVCIMGSIDEKNQAVTPGRYGSQIDVCIDMLGAVSAVVTAYRLTCRYRRAVLKQNGNKHPAV